MNEQGLHVCQNCDRSFQLKRGLTKHIAICNPSSKNFVNCTGCGKKFARQRTLDNHLLKCKNPIFNKQLQESLSKRKNNGASHPLQTSINSNNSFNNSNSFNTTNNNTTIQVLSIDSEALKALKLRDFYDMRTLADFHLKNTIKGGIIKTDAARGTIMYKLKEDDKPTKDSKAVKLASSLCEASREKALEIDEEAKQQLCDNISSAIACIYAETREICQGVAQKSAKAVELLGKAIVKQVPSVASDETGFTGLEQEIETHVGEFLTKLFEADKFKTEGNRIYVQGDDSSFYQNNDLVTEIIIAKVRQCISRKISQ